MIAHAARDMGRGTDEADLARFDGDNPDAWAALAEMADAMRHTEHRNDGAVGEDDAFRHLGKIGRYPVAARIEEAQAGGERHPFRQHQLDRFGGGIDAQRDTAGTGTLAHAERHVALGKSEDGGRRSAARTEPEHTTS